MNPARLSQPKAGTAYNTSGNPTDQTPQEKSSSAANSGVNSGSLVDQHEQGDIPVPSTHDGGATASSLGYGARDASGDKGDSVSCRLPSFVPSIWSSRSPLRVTALNESSDDQSVVNVHHRLVKALQTSRVIKCVPREKEMSTKRSSQSLGLVNRRISRLVSIGRRPNNRNGEAKLRNKGEKMSMLRVPWEIGVGQVLWREVDRLVSAQGWTGGRTMPQIEFMTSISLDEEP